MIARTNQKHCRAYKLVSAKGTRIVTGTLKDAVRAAREMDDELQPSFGVMVKDEFGHTVAEVS